MSHVSPDFLDQSVEPGEAPPQRSGGDEAETIPVPAEEDSETAVCAAFWAY